jgi:FkbM family methyltransferase
LARVNMRANWWPLGVYKVRSGAPVRCLSVAGRRIVLSFPAGEFDSQQWELNHLYCDDPYGLRDLPKDITNVLDVGANIGLFSILARHYFPKAVIHCYEPNPIILPTLLANTEGLGIVVTGAGLGAKPSRAMLIPHDTSLQGVLRSDDQGSIQIVSIHEAMDRLGAVIDLVKMDCEGGEWELIKDSAFLKRVRYLSMEYHLELGNSLSLSELIAQLKAHGFYIDALREAQNRVCGLLRASNSRNICRTFLSS